MKIELTLLVDANTRALLLRHPLLNAEGAPGPHEQTLSDTYFDTPELRLRHRDAALRVRHIGRRWIQTMIAGGRVNGGLYSRHEWESPLAGAVPDPAQLRKLVDDKKTRRDLFGASARARALVPIFTARIKRTVWNLHLCNGDRIECALDQGQLECGGKKVPIGKLELELKSGDPAHLFDFALALQQELPLRIRSHSTADCGYALLEPGAVAAVGATPLQLAPAMTTERAFQAIATSCLAHMQANGQGVAETHDVESLHQMRVGMRRLRSALGMFKEVLQVPEALQVELDWLAKELGDARDWDVLSGTTLPAMVKGMAEPALVDGVRAAAAAKAQAHHVAAAAVVSLPRYTRLMLSAARWIHTMDWHEDAAAMENAAERLAQPVTKFARQILRRDKRRLRARARNLRAATPEARHRVRIAAKKSRYAVEFFGSLFKPRTVRPYVKGLTGLQDELGLLNDAAVADRLLAEVAAAQPQLEAGAGFARGFLAAQVHSGGKKIVKRWKKFAPIPLPR